MKNLLPVTVFTLEAHAAKEKSKWWGILLMTLAIFFASQFTESIILVPFAFSCFFGTALFDTQGSCALSVPDWVQALILNLTLSFIF